ncbi:MAG TPA: hypothetical protein VIB79_00025 [Candidatus Binatia bacterium]
MTKIQRLQNHIRNVHQCDSSHLITTAVHYTNNRKISWLGDVEVFLLKDHPKAQLAYAWIYHNGSGEERDLAVLAIPPVDTALDAVRNYLTKAAEKTE